MSGTTYTFTCPRCAGTKVLEFDGRTVAQVSLVVPPSARVYCPACASEQAVVMQLQVTTTFPKEVA